MHLLDLTLDSPAENVALDEALIEQAEQSVNPVEIVRIWEPHEVMVVVGRSSKVNDEVRLDRCRQKAVPVLRRSSGGAAIVTGPGCLMYGLVMSYQLRPSLRTIDNAHQTVLAALASSLARYVPGVRRAGISDLVTADELKFSGNSLRCRRNYLLYHGTLLYDFPLHLIDRYLGTPPRQPDYRRGRDHTNFVTNLPLSGKQVREAVMQTWNCSHPLADWPLRETHQLVSEKYSREEWNFRH